MKSYIFSLLLILFAVTTQSTACPTCVAKVQQSSPPFFVDEFYIQSDEPFESDLITSGTNY